MPHPHNSNPPAAAARSSPGAPARSLGTRLSLVIGIVLVCMLSLYALALSSSSMRQLQDQARSSFAAQTLTLRDLVAQFDDTLQEEADRLLGVFAATVPGPYAQDPGVRVKVADQDTPRLRSGDTALNLNFDIPDRFLDITGGTVATVFERVGDDFVRVTTSLKTQAGARAIGTLLDRRHPAYAALMNDQPYRGLAMLFGAPYMSKYAPMRDAAGKVIGALFVGVNVTREVGILKERIRQKRVGDDDQFMLIDAAPGPDQGRLLAARQREGDKLLDDKDADGASWVRDMIAAREGAAVRRIAPDGGVPAEYLTAYATYPGWGWLIASMVPTASLHGDLAAARARFLAAGILLALALAAALWLLLRRAVGRPLAQAVQAADRIANGDLTARLASRRRDEIGRLLQAIDGIGSGLSGIVGTVRGGAASIAASTSQIASGNADLSNRTAMQAENLQATVSSLAQLSATVRQNTGNAIEAGQTVRQAVQAARDSGDTIARVVDSMAGIQRDAGQIENIIGLIDSIAFQTNILALNAAVESARAGEHGRGFAVVAGEVRTLAQRSAQAAREIKALVERTVGNVHDGNEAVRDAGAAIEALASQVERIAVSMDGINAASAEQARGIAHVQDAAARMDRATQENAALVEEAAAAAEHLNQQTHDLEQIVASFRLGDDGPAGGAAQAPLPGPAAPGLPRAR